MIGIDIGGSNLRAAVIGGATHPSPGIPRHLRSRVGEPRDPPTIVERIARICETLAPGGDTVGIGIAAMLRDREGTVANSPHLRWRDVPFGRLLQRSARGGRKCRFHGATDGRSSGAR